MDDSCAFLTEDAIQIKILDVQSASDFAGAIVLDIGSAGAVAAVGDIELVTIAPGAAGRDDRAFIIQTAETQVVFDKGCDGIVGDKSRQQFCGQSERGGNLRHIGLGTG